MKRMSGFLLLLSLPVLLWWGCETQPARPNQPPNTTLANIPVDGDTLFALVTLHWDGEDEDGFIAGYQYRYVTHHLLRNDSIEQPWRDTKSTSLTIAFESSDVLNLQRFQVRAVDNNGNVDPTPAEKRFYTFQTVFPQTEILFPGDNSRFFVIEQTTDWWLGIRIDFTAHDEDGEVVEYAWMVDGGDTTWTRDTTLYITPDRFREPLEGVHTIKVTSRDNTNLVDPVGDSVRIVLIRPTFDKDILIIDETNEANTPFSLVFPGLPEAARDDSVDAFYQRVFGPADNWDYKRKGMPSKEVLGQYRLVIWHADDLPSNQPHNLPRHVDILMDYMNVGGDFIMSGWRMLRSFAWLQNFPGDGSGTNFPEGSFIHDYLHIVSADETPLVGDFTYAEGLSGYQDVRVDSTKLTEFPYFGKLGQINVIPQRAGFTDVFLVYQNDLQSPLTWPRGHPIGLRYYGTSFDAAVFGFPLFFMVESDVQAMARRLLAGMGYD